VSADFRCSRRPIRTSYAFERVARDDCVERPRYACIDPDVTGLGFAMPEAAHRVRVKALEEVVRPAAHELGFM
jgi:hypothetical protein